MVPFKTPKVTLKKFSIHIRDHSNTGTQLGISPRLDFRPTDRLKSGSSCANLQNFRGVN